MDTIASFEVRYAQFVDQSGAVTTSPLPAFGEQTAPVVDLYRLMVLTRIFDTKAIALQRTGQLGTYASCLGQEAIGAGVGTAMRAEDVLVPTYREQAAQFARGVKMSEILLYWGGDERGSDFSACREDLPICVPIATQCGHAVGVASAFKLRRQARVAVCCCGDGATSKGDFYEALNLAGVWRLPVVFVVSNNHWAISVPRSAQTAAQTLAQKAISAGFDGIQVDGNDVIAVRWAAEQALERARDGGGPSLVEAITYRMHDHTTADDASRYRSDEELSAHRKADPLTRTRHFLTQSGAWSSGDEEQLREECAGRVQTAVEEYLRTPDEGPQAMFDHLYAALPTALQAQRQCAMDEDSADRDDSGAGAARDA